VTSSRVSANSQDRVLLSRLVAAEEHLRDAIASELHDDAVQALAASVMHLGVLPAKAEGVAGQPSYDRSLSNLRYGLQATRDVLHKLRAPLLAERGIGPAVAQALERLERVTGWATRLEWLPAERFDPVVETVVFRAVQEALVNAERHAKAGAVTVTGSLTGVRNDGELVVTVEDDGAGFEPAAVVRGGLDRAARRLELAGGRFEAGSRPGRGTTVTIAVPANPVEPA
jgi:two-component system sensor histidine kinase DegS